MKHVLIALLAAYALSAQTQAPIGPPVAEWKDTIEAFGYRWAVPVAADWKVEAEGPQVLKMLMRRPQEQPRRPSQFAIAQTPDFEQVTVEAEVKRVGGSLIIVYAFRDKSHFDYAHLSVDEATKQPVHNGIFHVFGGERVRISSTEGPASLPSDKEWYKVRLEYGRKPGYVEVFVNDRPNPSLQAYDLSIRSGKVGIGSFFETAWFRNVRITGRTASASAKPASPESHSRPRR